MRYTFTRELYCTCVICVKGASRVLWGIEVSIRLFRFVGSPSTIQDAQLKLNFR